MSQKAILKQGVDANDKVIQILLEKDELSWKNIIYELVNTAQMDPWDIDVSQLAEKFLEMIRTLQEMDFRITGKIVLAAALLLKIKSNQLLEEDLTALDSLISGAEDPVELLDELPQPFDFMEEEDADEDQPALVPRTPQPRKRKVAVDDLVTALEKALKVEMRRISREDVEEMTVEVEDVDISKVIMDVYKQVHTYYQENEEKLTFKQLVPENASKDDKVFTFIPLLHLDHQRNIDLMQDKTFGEIFIDFLKEADGEIKVEAGDLGS